MDHAARGADSLPTNPLTALEHYTRALIQHPTSPDYYTARSTCFTRLKNPPPRYDLALQDAELAVLLARERGKREVIQKAQMRRVVSLFGLKRYGDAGFVLDSMVRWRREGDKKGKMEGDVWKAKIDQRVKAEDGGTLEIMVTEYPEGEVPDAKELTRILESELNGDGTYRFDGEGQDEAVLEDDEQTIDGESAAADSTSHLGNLTEITSDGANESTDSISLGEIKVERSASISHAPTPPFPIASPIKGPTSPSNRPDPFQSIASAPPTLSKVRHEWYQNAQTVTLTIYAKGVPKDKTDVDIAEDAVFISFPHPSNPSTAFTFSLDPLFALVDTTDSKYSIMSTKVELILKKKVPGQKWSALESTGSTQQTSTIPTTVLGESTNKPTGPVYPTSSKSGAKDWDKLASDLTAKTKKKKKTSVKDSKKKDDETINSKADDEEEDGDDSGVDSDTAGDPVDGFFKKLYAGADEDTKRAMMKSFQESGGTALSTNWGEVGKGKVEPVDGS